MKLAGLTGPGRKYHLVDDEHPLPYPMSECAYEIDARTVIEADRVSLELRCGMQGCKQAWRRFEAAEEA